MVYFTISSFFHHFYDTHSFFNNTGKKVLWFTLFNFLRNWVEGQCSVQGRK